MTEKETQMTHAQKDTQAEDQLEGLFQAARQSPPPVPPALMARVLADAQRMQPSSKIEVRSWFQRIGGLPALGGLVSASCLGFWIGVAPPDVLPDLGGAVIGLEYAADEFGADEETDGFGWGYEEG